MRPIKIFSAICLLGLSVVFMNACSKCDSNGNGSVGFNPGVQNIAIQSTGFNPATVTVMVGSKITWTNTDTGDHTVTSDDGTSFNSGTISPNGTFSFTPTMNGTITYHCSLHPTMTGRIQVVTR